MQDQVVHGIVHCADVLTNIAQRLTDMDDFGAFRLSSTLFKQAAPLDNFKGLYLRRNVPYLMLPAKDDGTEYNFFSLAKEKVVAKTTLPEAKGKRWFESQGWLLMFGDDPEKSISLLHPFKHLEIGLPNEEEFLAYGWSQTYENIHKMVLSSRSHKSSDFALLVIYGLYQYLGLWKPGNQLWITKPGIPSSIVDVAYCNHQFFTIDYRGRVSLFDVEGPIMDVLVVSLPCEGNHSYIVESSGKLLVVSWRPGKFHADELSDEEFYDPIENMEEWEDVRYLREKMTYEGPGFDLFEVNPVTNSWEQIQDLGGKALFIGSNSATLLIDATRGIKVNHIYYAGTPWLFGAAAFIYKLEDGMLERLEIGNSVNPVYPPLWIAPSF